MSYDIEAIKKRIADLSKQNQRGGAGNSNATKLTYFKPKLGANELRFLPYNDGSGQPFQQIDYYDCKELTERRTPTPKQWSLPDPVADLVTELEKNRSNDATWQMMRKLRVKEANYAPVFVRGQEDKGVQIWELNQTVLTQIYSILAHPDFCDENLFDAKNGYDFTITCTDSGKTTVMNGKTFTVKNYDVQPRRKSSPLMPTEKERAAIVASIPDLNANFKQFVLNEEKLKIAVTNFLSAGMESEHTEEKVVKKSIPEAESKASSKIEDAFADLDD